MVYSISIDPDLLVSHAGDVDQVAGHVRVAVQAAGQTMLSSPAFGLMCAWMVPPFLMTAGAASATLVSAAAALDRSARNIRGIATDFESGETTASGEVSGIRSAVDAV